MVVGGVQKLLVNEFNKEPTFYKMVGPEDDIRGIAQKFRNSYQIAVFACCREILSRTRHSGGITKEKAKELLEIYRRR